MIPGSTARKPSPLLQNGKGWAVAHPISRGLRPTEADRFQRRSDGVRGVRAAAKGSPRLAFGLALFEALLPALTPLPDFFFANLLSHEFSFPPNDKGW